MQYHATCIMQHAKTCNMLQLAAFTYILIQIILQMYGGIFWQIQILGWDATQKLLMNDLVLYITENNELMITRISRAVDITVSTTPLLFQYYYLKV